MRRICAAHLCVLGGGAEPHPGGMVLGFLTNAGVAPGRRVPGQERFDLDRWPPEEEDANEHGCFADQSPPRRWLSA